MMFRQFLMAPVLAPEIVALATPDAYPYNRGAACS